MTISEAKELAKKILDMVDDIPSPHIEKLVSAWHSDVRITKYNLEAITGISGQKARDLMLLITNSPIEQSVLSAMFVAGLEAKYKMANSVDEIEIVWTGPPSINTGTRSTKPVIEEMLKSSRRGEKITIVGYRITSGAKAIISQLRSCLENGVEIDLIVDKSHVNKTELKKCFPEKSLVRPNIYTRKDKESKFYKVHAKVILIQDRQMLISSANLTELGTEVNFEMGLMVSGPVVKKTSELIAQMIREEYFVGSG